MDQDGEERREEELIPRLLGATREGEKEIELVVCVDFRSLRFRSGDLACDSVSISACLDAYVHARADQSSVPA